MFSGNQMAAVAEAAVMLIDAGYPDRAAWLLRQALAEGDGRRTITGVKMLLRRAGIEVAPPVNWGVFRVRSDVALLPPSL